jgi:hypothetical protein
MVLLRDHNDAIWADPARAGGASDPARAGGASERQWNLAAYRQPPIPVPHVSVVSRRVSEADAIPSAGPFHPSALSPGGVVDPVGFAFHSAPATPCRAGDVSARVSEAGRPWMPPQSPPDDTPTHYNHQWSDSLPSHGENPSVHLLRQRLINDAARNIMDLGSRVLDLSR